jgi:hypothetical protein
MNSEARKRSVENLQRVYTIVISLAIVESLRRLFQSVDGLPDFPSLVSVICLLFTIVPFYHGANRYLDSTYVTGERSAKPHALILDFVILFLEGLIFFILSLLILNTQLFFTLLAFLFIIDAGWVWITRYTSTGETEIDNLYISWSIVNFIAAGLLLISMWSNLLNWSLWKTETVELIFVLMVVVIRSILDYVTVWNFYYPPTPESPYIMPIPRPAYPPGHNRKKLQDIISINEEKVNQIASILISTNIPHEEESSPHEFNWDKNLKDLANCYLAIVAICHQTSPQGEVRLSGSVKGVNKEGWDYLNEKFLTQSMLDPCLATPIYWAKLTPSDLSEIYDDDEKGRTLNRINERTFLINDLGRRMSNEGFTHIEDIFNSYQKRIGGEKGFLPHLKKFEAYSDPLSKKAFFFLSLVKNECGWSPIDPQNILSPIDYHELRGHLRIGTIIINDNNLLRKVRNGIPLSVQEDLEIRAKAQLANSQIASLSGFTSSVLHYLLWNVFRNCCPRESHQTHCESCVDNCNLPSQYKGMMIYHGNCIFSQVCSSKNLINKVVDPPYVGHYY